MINRDNFLNIIYIYIYIGVSHALFSRYFVLYYAEKVQYHLEFFEVIRKKNSSYLKRLSAKYAIIHFLASTHLNQSHPYPFMPSYLQNIMIYFVTKKLNVYRKWYFSGHAKKQNSWIVSRQKCKVLYLHDVYLNFSWWAKYFHCQHQNAKEIMLQDNVPQCFVFIGCRLC